jgi:hypothetical protein
MRLSALVAGAVAAAVLAAVTVWAFTRLPGLWVWAAFVGWASYDQSGANRHALLTSSVCMVFGVLMAWLVALSVAGGLLPVSGALASALAAGVASFFIVYLSKIRVLANVPATFYGFASTFAYLLLAPAAFTISAMKDASLRNVAICVPISLLIGSVLGVVHQRLAGWLTEPSALHDSQPVRLTPLKKGATVAQ